MDTRKSGKRRCDKCGFLVLHFWNDTGLYEATQEYREKGVDEGLSGSLSRPPLCLVQASRIDLEVEAHNTATAGPRMAVGAPSIVAVIQKSDRNCSKWRQWIPGFSPKEHFEMRERRYLARLRLVEVIVLALTLLAVVLVPIFVKQNVINNNNPTINILMPTPSTSDSDMVEPLNPPATQSRPGSNAP